MINFLKRKKNSSRPFYITTTLPYANAKPHIGHVMEFVRADTIARYQRMNYQIQNNQEINSAKSENVFFNTGTDEHGMKIYQKAQEEGLDTQSFVDEQSKTFSDLKEVLDISYDKFIRTTDVEHIAAAQEFWKKCDERGYIYKKNYSGLYCVGCESFVNEKDLIKGECPDHPGKKPETISEENYFFKYSNFAGDLLKLYKKKDNDGKSIVIPGARLNEIEKLVKNGLEDFSISRLKNKMPWGVPVPNDENHVMYVWFDALVNYISTLGWPDETGDYRKFWKGGRTVQICGKDNLQFQAARWQAMLLSVGLPPTNNILINGFVTSNGQKMSKTVGNVVDPIDYVNKYGSEAVRYFSTRELHPSEDSDFTEEKFIEAYNANLANGIGNVVSRVLKMAETNEVKISEYELSLKIKKVWAESKKYHTLMSDFNLQKAADEVWQNIANIDNQIAETEPFKLVKKDPEKAKEIIEDLVLQVWAVAILVEPFLPKTSDKIKRAVIEGKKPESLFNRI